LRFLDVFTLFSLRSHCNPEEAWPDQAEPGHHGHSPSAVDLPDPGFHDGYSLAMADGSTFGITNDYPLDNWLSFIAAGDHFLRTVVANVH
jgi:hypothetical protein